MFLRKSSDGDYYVCSRRGGKKHFRNWFLIKFGTSSCGLLLGRLTLPKEFAGKKIMLKVITKKENLTNGERQAD